MKNLFLLTLIALLFACNNTADKKPLNESPTTNKSNALAVNESVDKKSTFVHVVYFWMNEMTEEQTAGFEKALEVLGTVPSIDRYEWGTPAPTTRKDEVVDDSYDYAWITYHKDKAAQDAYQVDPIHLEFVDQNKKYFKKVVVYDSILK